MPDIIDIASEREELFRERAIAEAIRRYRPMPITGRCYNCEEKTPGNFCCPECREDWEKHKHAERQRVTNSHTMT
ncbi:hypothetical protein [Sodalis sp.]|uniref:hypothetical protein n=1 Tax=Sodalis sp. (in: enterobacteria) TaxID=1898979 RepID=UPI003873C707